MSLDVSLPLGYKYCKLRYLEENKEEGAEGSRDYESVGRESNLSGRTIKLALYL